MKVTPDHPDFPHGERGYRRGCKCGDCRAGWRDYMRRRRGSKPRPEVAEHGTRSGYNNCTAGPGGKKCEACKKANRDYQREYMRTMRNGEAWAPMRDDLIDRAMEA